MRGGCAAPAGALFSTGGGIVSVQTSSSLRAQRGNPAVDRTAGLSRRSAPRNDGFSDRVLKFVVALLVGLTIQPAQACSFSWKSSYSPKQIPHRADVWKVKGDFKPIDAETSTVVAEGAITLSKDTGDNGEMLGKIDRKRGKPVMTRQYYYEQWAIDCGFILTPQGAATGNFWLERKPDKQGRYRMLMWRPEKGPPKRSAADSKPTQGDGK
jgi:hypothetical protein